MPICINRNGDIFEEIVEMPEDEVEGLELDAPLTHALVVARNDEGYLLMFNRWKKHWELAGGIREEGETIRECAVRELLEETNQIPSDLRFAGLMKFTLRDGRVEYGGLFCATIAEVRPFERNDEALEIVYWDGERDIGYIDEIDLKLLSYYR